MVSIQQGTSEPTEQKAAWSRVPCCYVIKLKRDFRAKEIARSTRRHSPTASVDIVGIRPQQIAKRALVRDLLIALERADLIDCRQVGAQPAVQAQDRPVDDGGDRQIVERFHTVLPRIGTAVLSETLIVQTVHLTHLPAA
jgi:hypothetical protein